MSFAGNLILFSAVEEFKKNRLTFKQVGWIK